VFATQLIAETLHDVEDGLAGPRRAACSVLERYRETEARQQPLFIALHHSAAELADWVLARLREGPKHTSLVLHVQLQIRLGPEQIGATNQNSQLTALGFAVRADREGGRWFRTRE